MEEKLPFELPEFKLEEIKEDSSLPLGTFKSVKTLKEAYDSLRSCFTKNAMELAEIKKNLAQKAIFSLYWGLFYYAGFFISTGLAITGLLI